MNFKSFILQLIIALSMLIFSLAFSIKQQNVDDVAKNLAKNALYHFNMDNNDLYHWTLKKINDFRNTMDGKRYGIELLVAQTDCRKDIHQQKIEQNMCSRPKNAPIKSCKFEIITNNNKGFEEYVNHGCEQNNDNMNYNQLETMKIAEPKMLMYLKAIQNDIRVEELELFNLFGSFVGRYSKVYSSKAETLERFNTYKRNIKLAQLYQNNEYGTAEYGETQFMDLSPKEFQDIYLPYNWPKTSGKKRVNFADSSDDDIPSSFDWREQNVVTEVKNQGMCGSCWAFSVIGNIEGQWAIKTKQLISLSEQELVDCDSVDQGCNGGFPLSAYKEVIRIGGLEKEKDYPYDAKKHTCSLVRSEIDVYINSSIQIEKDETDMAIWLFKNGPISVGVNAMPLQFYRHGISHPWKIFCSPDMLNHGVLVVGYGKENNKPFWIIKNSWGSKWGESGYYRLYRGKNVCGIREMATSAIIL